SGPGDGGRAHRGTEPAARGRDARAAGKHRGAGRGDPADRAAPHHRARDLASALRRRAWPHRVRGHSARPARQRGSETRMAGSVMEAERKAAAPFEREGTVAVITLDNAPVNGLGHDLRKRIVDVIDAAVADYAVQAIVLIGADGLFSGGADIREFNTPKASAEPTLHTVIRIVESCAKPVTAAISGHCLGGGLELSLACHCRVAAPDAQVGLPEVKIGILPGAGGTQ